VEDRKVIVTIKKTLPAVVSIAVSKHLEDLEKELPPDTYPFLPRSGAKRPGNALDFFADNRGMIEVGGGSGFFADSNGTILTNKHIVGDAEAEYTVITADGKRFQTKILSRDDINDIAILKIEGSKFPTIPLGDSLKLVLGQSVITIGNALDVFRNSVSLGIVSGLSRSITAHDDPEAPFLEMRGLIQTDAAMNPGNSGGPLIDLSGKAVGINAAIVSGAEGISFAIPINAAKRDFEDIRRYGHIRRPFLGVRYLTIDENLKEKMKLSVDYGALVIKETPHDRGVAPKSPAEKAGVREKDIILEVNGTKVDRDHPIQDIIEDLAAGSEVELRILREGRELKVRAALAERK